MEAETDRRPSSDFAVLTGTIRQAGLLRQRVDFYARRIGLTFLAFVATWTMFVLLGDSWWQLVTACVLAVVWTQMSFIGHDAGHLQIFSSTRANDVVGYVHGDLLSVSGTGGGSASTTPTTRTPTTRSATPTWTSGSSPSPTPRPPADGAAPRTMAEPPGRPVLPAAAARGRGPAHLRGPVAPRAAGRPGAGDRPAGRPHRAYFAAVFLVLSPGVAVVFIVVHQGLLASPRLSFAPGTRACPCRPREKLDPVRSQVLTSRNIRGGRVPTSCSAG